MRSSIIILLFHAPYHTFQSEGRNNSKQEKNVEPFRHNESPTLPKTRDVSRILILRATVDVYYLWQEEQHDLHF